MPFARVQRGKQQHDDDRRAGVPAFADLSKERRVLYGHTPRRNRAGNRSIQQQCNQQRSGPGEYNSPAATIITHKRRADFVCLIQRNSGARSSAVVKGIQWFMIES